MINKISKRLLSLILCLAVLASALVVSGNIFSEGTSDGETFINRLIDYDKYTVTKGGNTYYSETDGTLWQNVVYDESASGGAYLAVKGNPDMGPFTNWTPHHTIVMTESGYHNTTAGDPDNLAFPTNTTFRVTLKIRAKDYSNFRLGIRYGNSYASSNGTVMDQHDISKLVVKNEWTEISYVFTTPTAYNGEYTKCFLTLTSTYWDADKQATIYREEYDLDWIKLEQLSGGEAYNEVGDTYTFNFNDGDSAKTYAANSDTSMDVDGRVFYPLHSTNSDTTAQQVAVETADGTIGALKITNVGQTSFIPVDENGKPYMIDPNAKYEVKINAYAQYMGVYHQAFFGGGAASSNSSEYTQYDNAWNGQNNMLFPGTDKNSVADVTSNYALYKTDSFMYTETTGNYYATEADAKAATTKQRVRYYADTTEMPKYSTTLSFTTLDYTEDTSSVINGSIISNRPANTITVTGYKRSDETVTATNTYGTYFCITIGGGSVTPWISNGDGTATKAGDTMYQTVYIDSITITKKSQTASVAFDANGGTFSDGSTTLAAEIQSVGSTVTPSLEVSTTAKNTFLQGWSLTADGSSGVYTSVTAEMHNKTVYAIWLSDPHTGGYNPVTRYIDFSKYSVTNANSYYDDSVDRTPDANNPYFYTVIEDETATGGHYLQFNMYSGESNWRANWNLTMSETGDAADMVFPENAEIHVKMRMRVHNLSGASPTLYVLYGAGTATGAYGTNAKNETVLNPSPAITVHPDEWVDYEFSFTTPEEYTVVDGTTYNRCFIGIMVPNNVVKYDIDTITLEQRTATNLYVKNGSSYELFDTVYGIPGNDLTLPTEFKEEIYATDGTGYAKVTEFSGWYSDEEGTEAAIPKFGNFGVDLYCPSTTVTTASSAGQLAYVGFDTYEELYDGMSIDRAKAQPSKEASATGHSSMKTTLSAGESTAFELKNADTIEVYNGKTYQMTFSYKSDKDIELSLGVGDPGNVPGTAVAVNTTNLSATDEWQEVTLTLDAYHKLGDLPRGYVSAMIVNAVEDTTAYFDNIKIYGITDIVGVEGVTTDSGEALRFMATYNCGGDSKFTVENEELAISERGVLVTGADNSTELTLNNAGTNGIMKVTATDLAQNWSQNAVTKSTVYSVLVNGLEAEDDYKFTARGYLKLSNGTVWYSDLITASVADIPEGSGLIPAGSDIVTGYYTSSSPNTVTADENAQSFGDYYIWLPEGTTFTSDKEFGVFAYSDYFAYGTDRASSSAIDTAEKTLLKPSYVRLSVKNGTVYDVEITVPDELKFEVLMGTKNELCLGENFEIISQKIDAFSHETVNYIFITDLHAGAYLRKDSSGALTVYESDEEVEARNQRLKNQVAAIVEMANNDDDIDFVAFGGDMINGYDTDETSKEDNLKHIETYLEPLNDCTKPVFVAFGNHDHNAAQSTHANYSGPELEWIISDKDWNDRVLAFAPDTIVQDPDYEYSKYYYYDLPEKNTRVIVLDTMDQRRPFDENGVVTGAATLSSFTYTQPQLDWLVNDAMTAPDGWNYSFISHMGIDSSTNNNTMGNGAVLRSIIGAFNNKTAYTNDSLGIDVDYTETSGRILSYSFGHQHAELVLYSEDINLWQVCTSCANTWGGSGDIRGAADLTLPWKNLTGRKADTRYESCIDVMSVNEDICYKFGVGAATDAVMIYPEAK